MKRDSLNEQSEERTTFRLAMEKFTKRSLERLFEELGGTIPLVVYIEIARAIRPELGLKARDAYVELFSTVWDEPIGKQLVALKRVAFLAKDEALAFKPDNKLEQPYEAARRLLPDLYSTTKVQCSWEEKVKLRKELGKIITDEMRQHKGWALVRELKQILEVEKLEVEFPQGIPETFEDVVARLLPEWPTDPEKLEKVNALIEKMIAAGLDLEVAEDPPEQVVPQQA